MSVVAYVLVWWLPALDDDSATSRGPNQMTPLHDCIDFDTETYIYSLFFILYFFLITDHLGYLDYHTSFKINNYINF
jgi:hypothetical protein